MKNIKRALTGKKACNVAIVIASICAALEIVSSARRGVVADYGTMTIVCSCLTCWACSLKKEEKKENE